MSSNNMFYAHRFLEQCSIPPLRLYFSKHIIEESSPAVYPSYPHFQNYIHNQFIDTFSVALYTTTSTQRLYWHAQLLIVLVRHKSTKGGVLDL